MADEAPKKELPPEVVDFLAKLRDDDLELLASAIKFMRSVVTVGWLIRWIIITAVAAFVMMASLGDAIQKIKNYWIAGGGLR